MITCTNHPDRRATWTNRHTNPVERVISSNVREMDLCTECMQDIFGAGRHGRLPGRLTLKMLGWNRITKEVAI